MGPAALNTPCPRRGVHDSIRDGANRIDAREPLSCAAAAGRLPQQTHRVDISACYPSRSGGPISTKIFSGFWAAKSWGLTRADAKTQAAGRGVCGLEI